MSDLFKPGQTAAILRRFGLRPTKSLGQHFLVDDNIRRKIVKTAALSSQDYVLEIGAGIGALTVALAAKCKRVAAVEVDRRLLAVLTDITSLMKNIKILPVDGLKLTAADLEIDGELPNSMVSNLPYNIAAPLLIKYLENFEFITDYTVMVQKEIARRILATAGGKDYGAFTLKLRFLADTKAAFDVPRRAFLPPPRVDSSVIRLRRRVDKSISQSSLFNLIDAAFSQRRKKMVNAASEALKIDKKELIEALVDLKLSPDARAETFKLVDFLRLCERLAAIIKKP